MRGKLHAAAIFLLSGSPSQSMRLFTNRFQNGGSSGFNLTLETFKILMA